MLNNEQSSRKQDTPCPEAESPTSEGCSGHADQAHRDQDTGNSTPTWSNPRHTTKHNNSERSARSIGDQIGERADPPWHVRLVQFVNSAIQRREQPRTTRAENTHRGNRTAGPREPPGRGHARIGNDVHRVVEQRASRAVRFVIRNLRRRPPQHQHACNGHEHAQPLRDADKPIKNGRRATQRLG